MERSPDSKAGPDAVPRIDLAAALAALDEIWSPRTVATVNDCDVRLVKTAGEFVRHAHPDTDELFLVLKGGLTIRMAEGDVELGPGQMCVIPQGVEHQPVSAEGRRSAVGGAQRDRQYWR